MKFTILLTIFLYSSQGDFVLGDYQGPAEDAVYSQLTQGGSRSDPLDTLAYSILVGHMKRRPTGGSSTDPHISSYFVVDTISKNDQGRFQEPDAHSLENTRFSTGDYSPVDYQLSANDFQTQKQQQVSSSVNTAQPSREQGQSSRKKVQKKNRNSRPKTSRTKTSSAEDSFSSGDANSVRNSRPEPSTAPNDKFVDSREEQFRNSIPRQQPKDTKVSEIDGEQKSNYRPQISSDELQYDFPNGNDNQVQHFSPDLPRRQETFQNSFSSIINNRIRNSRPLRPLTKDSIEYSTADFIDLPTHPTLQSTGGNLQISEHNNLRPRLQIKTPQVSPESEKLEPEFDTGVRSSVPVPIPSRSPTHPVPFPNARPTPAISSPIFRDLQNSPSKNIPESSTYQENFEQIQNSAEVGPSYSISSPSNEMHKAVEILTQFSEDFVSKDIKGPPASVPVFKSAVRPSFNTIDVAGLHVVRPGFRIRPINPFMFQNPIQFGSPSVQNNIYSSPVIRSRPREPQSLEVRSVHNDGEVVGEASNLRPVVAPFLTVKNSMPPIMRRPANYEMFKSIVREIH